MSKQRIRQRHARHLADDSRTETVTVAVKRAPKATVSGAPVAVEGLEAVTLQLMPVPKDGPLATAAPNLAGGRGNYLGIAAWGLALLAGDVMEADSRTFLVQGVGDQWPTFTALAVSEPKA